MIRTVLLFITIKFSDGIHRNPEDQQYAQHSSNPLSSSNSGYRHPQQRQNSPMHLQQSTRQQTSASSMLRTPISTMHQQERKYTEQFHRLTGVPRIPRHADVARFPAQANVPRFPRQMSVTRFPEQAGDSSRNQHTQQIPPHVQYQPQTLQNIQNRTHTEDRYMFHPYLPRDY